MNVTAHLHHLGLHLLADGVETPPDWCRSCLRSGAMKRSTWLPGARWAIFAGLALFSMHCGQSERDEEGEGAAHNGTSGAGASSTIAEAGAGGAPADPCPATRPEVSRSCLEEHWFSTCTYGSEKCDCFTPNFMYQPPLWRCAQTGTGGSG